MNLPSASGALLLAALVSCAHPGARPPADGRVADAGAPPRAAFVAYPAAEVAAVKSPHDYKGKALCQRCHEPSLALVKPVNALCRECHPQQRSNHPVDVLPKTKVTDLPLLAGGKVGCHTCHDPHRKKLVLRKEFSALCLTCHPKH